MSDYDVVLITDPEMAMVEDPFPIDTPVHGVGGFVGEWPSFLSMIEARTDLERELQTMTQMWQFAIRPPAYIKRTFVSETGPLSIYGKLMTPGQAYIEERKAGSSMAESNLFLRRVRDAALRGWLYGRFYSVITPEGETGCTHRCQIDGVLSAQEWRMVEELRWA